MDLGKHEFFLCMCGNEAVAVNWAWWDEYDVEIYLSMWQYGRCNWNSSWRERLRHVWRIVKTGYPYLDDITLTSKQALELGEKLIEFSKMTGKDR